MTFVPDGKGGVKRCPAWTGHHIGEYCPVCGNDERHISGSRPNPDWDGYQVDEFVARWALELQVKWTGAAYEFTGTRKHPLTEPPTEVTLFYSHALPKPHMESVLKQMLLLENAKLLNDWLGPVASRELVRNEVRFPKRFEPWVTVVGGPRVRTLREFKELQPIDSAHFDNVYYDDGQWCVMLSRMTVADGAPYDNQVTVQRMVRGVWQTYETYQAR